MPVTASRLNLARAAIRPEMKGKLLLSGAPGSGKTFSALTIAEVLAGPEGRTLVIDTEKDSAQTYADLFRFEHLKWAAPFDPRALADTVADASGVYDVIVVDSLSHFWRKAGGTLDIANGRFTGWKDARPAQEDMVEAFLDADSHVILCGRSKMEHAQQADAAGKIQVIKLGMAVQQDDDLEYEVNVALELDMQHVLSVSKSRTNAVPVGRTFTAGHADEFAQLYRDWLKAGEPIAERAQVDELIVTLNQIPDRGERGKAKEAFLEVFGRPEFLLQSRLGEAADWVADRVLQIVSESGGPSPEAGDGASTSGEATDPAYTATDAVPNGESPAAPPAADELPPCAQDADDGPDLGPPKVRAVENDDPMAAPFTESKKRTTTTPKLSGLKK